MNRALARCAARVQGTHWPWRQRRGGRVAFPRRGELSARTHRGCQSGCLCQTAYRASRRDWNGFVTCCCHRSFGAPQRRDAMGAAVPIVPRGPLRRCACSGMAKGTGRACPPGRYRVPGDPARRRFNSAPFRFDGHVVTGVPSPHTALCA